jgi:hypothetical protein
MKTFFYLNRFIYRCCLFFYYLIKLYQPVWLGRVYILIPGLFYFFKINLRRLSTFFTNNFFFVLARGVTRTYKFSFYKYLVCTEEKKSNS